MRHIRKYLTILISVILLCMCFSGAYAEGLLSLSVSTESGTTEDTVAVLIGAANCREMEAIQFTVNYDPAVLKVQSVTPGTMLENGVTELNDFNDGVIYFAYANAYGLTEESGNLLSISFELLSDTGGAVTISDCLAWNYLAESGESKAYVTVQNGGVTAVATGLVPEPLNTPWVPETPTPVPTGTPRPTSELSAMAKEDPEGFRNILKMGILLVILILIALVIVWIVLKTKDRRNRY